MSIFDKGKQLLGEAEKEAGAHPQETEKLLGEAEQLVEKDTGGKYDKQIQEAGTKLEEQVVGTPPPASEAGPPATTLPVRCDGRGVGSATRSPAGRESDAV